MLDLAEQITRAVDEAVAPVTADEARARAGSRTHFRCTAVLATVVSVLLLLGAMIAALAAVGVGRHSTTVRAGANSSTTITSTPTTVTSVPIPTGRPVGLLDIPALNMHWVVVQGSSLAAEAEGPMHDPETPLPGQRGNVAIGGHRVTHGAPFYRLDELRPGDAIRFTTPAGVFVYKVDGHFVVPAEGGAIFPAKILDRLRDRIDSLTLVTDTPRYSAAQRLVVIASRR